MENGFVKLYRSIDRWEWRDDPNTFSVFSFFLTNARHEPGSWKGIRLNPGQLITSYEHISTITGISMRGVRTALDDHLIATGYVSKKTTNKFTIITVENWDFWQSKDNKNDKQSDKHSVTPATTNKNVKNIKNTSPTPSKGDTRFDEFWNAYPKKVGKKNAQQRWQKLRINDETYRKIMEAVKAQSESDQWKKDGGQYIPYPATWLSQERWEDQLPTVEQHSEKPAMYSGDLYS